MQSSVLRVSFAVTCFLLSAVLFLFLLTCLYVSVQTSFISAQGPSFQLFSHLIAVGCLTIMLSAGSIGIGKIGLRLLHTKIQNLQPPNAEYGYLRLLASILLVTIGLELIFMGIAFPYAIWHELQKSVFAMVLIVMLGVFLVGIGMVIVRWGSKVKKSAFRKEEIEFLGKTI